MTVTPSVRHTKSTDASAPASQQSAVVAAYMARTSFRL